MESIALLHQMLFERNILTEKPEKYGLNYYLVTVFLSVNSNHVLLIKLKDEKEL